jgi:hypothetical protein
VWLDQEMWRLLQNIVIAARHMGKHHHLNWFKSSSSTQHTAMIVFWLCQKVIITVVAASHITSGIATVCTCGQLAGQPGKPILSFQLTVEISQVRGCCYLLFYECFASLSLLLIAFLGIFRALGQFSSIFSFL